MEHAIVIGVFKNEKLVPEILEPKAVTATIQQAEFLVGLLRPIESELPSEYYLAWDYAEKHKISVP